MDFDNEVAAAEGITHLDIFPNLFHKVDSHLSLAVLVYLVASFGDYYVSKCR